MFNFFYQSLTLILSLIAFPLFCLTRRGRFLLKERYGFWNNSAEYKSSEYEVIWLHAASFGEVNALTPVVKLLRQKHVNDKILITVTSDTGYLKAAEIADFAHICPFDNCIWLKNALGHLKIKRLIIAETEIWPAMLIYAGKRNIPAYLINARISDYTLGIYKKLSLFLSPLLNTLKKIIVINKESKDRFLEIGISADLLSIAGYSKYDIDPEVKSQNEAEQLRKNYFNNLYPVITLGSIRPGEEEIWFPAVKRAYLESLKFNLIIVPRHQDKFEYFAEKLTQYGINYVAYTRLNSPSEKAVLLDVMGKLPQVYSFSSLAFIGASLVNIGGHNPLEPACYQCAVCIGPHYNNVRDIVDKLKIEGAITIINNTQEAYSLIRGIAENDPLLKQGAVQAMKFWNNNYGASLTIINSMEMN